MKAIEIKETTEKTYYCVSGFRFEYHFDTLAEARKIYDLLCARNESGYIALKKVTENETAYYSKSIAIRY